VPFQPEFMLRFDEYTRQRDAVRTVED